jgi:hypothetical protein
VDDSVIRRYDQRHNVLRRIWHDSDFPGYMMTEEEPGWEPACSSNNPGALKWYVDAEKCYLY